MDSGRVLCSHLVQVRIDGAERAPEWANLEELDAFGAVLGSEREWPTQVEIVIETEGFRAPAFVQSCRRRETDHALVVEFTGGFRWDPEAWRPDHAYAAPAQTKSAKAGG
ncbi:MAG: hypothetical protein KDC27_05415 [Acidobacteria bacterium]|nr:hypothetical protein [Acidobacteriota bacterium]